MGEAKITKAMTKDAAITATDVSTKEAIAKGTKVQRNYKDTVSRMLFREPENALSLYNALNAHRLPTISSVVGNYPSSKNEIMLPT